MTMPGAYRLCNLAGLFIACALLLGLTGPVQAAGPWTAAANLQTGRADHTATLLASGKVLVAAGYACTGSNGVGCSYATSAELYDPVDNTWSAAGTLATGRSGHTATLLNTGKVLIVGGNNGAELASAELYDPVSNTWSAAASLHVAREYHTATLLPSGKVLVAGGGGGCTDGTCTGENGVYPPAEPTTELYDPVSDTWTVAASLIMPRANAAAALLQSGKVLLAGGIGCDGTVAINCVAADNEVYDPAANTWTATGTYYNAEYVTANLLASGEVLVAGGIVGGIGYQTESASSSLYAPASNSWNASGNLSDARAHHSATVLASGQVLVTGGDGSSSTLASSELYDPVKGVWYTLPSLTLNTARTHHTATLLVSGQVLVTGGYGGSVTTLASTELYDPSADTYTVTATAGANGNITVATQTVSAGLPASFTVSANNGYHASVSGDTCAVTQVSGVIWTSTPIMANCAVTASFVANSGNGLWSDTDSMSAARVGHTATLLASGKVLVASAGSNFFGYSLTSAEVYDPASSTWDAAGNLATARFGDTATLLPSGKVLVVGGTTGLYSYLASAELYDTVSNTWSAAASMSTPRYFHTATLLPSGKVLVAGGGTNSAELYDPASNTWSPAGNLSVARTHHTATLLPSGKVLVAGGSTLATAELYDPTANSWSAAANLTTARISHTATLLSSGKVLVVGGYDNCNGNGGCVFLASAELYDPAGDTWSTGGGLAIARSGHTATLLPSGQVLIAGGSTSTSSNCDNYGDSCTVLASSELYDPAGNDFSPTASLITARNGHTATLLASGDVLAVGGLGSSDNTSTLSSAEIYGSASNVFSITATAGANGTITPAAATMHLGSHVVFSVSPSAGYHANVSGNTCSVAQMEGSAWISSAIAANCVVTTSFSANAYAGTWATTASLASARELHTATLLPLGKVLVVGGANGAALANAELYDPVSGTWSAAASPAEARAAHTATLLASGKVLVVGGGPLATPLASAELYDPASNTWSAAGSLGNARTQHTATLLPSGKVLVAGGVGSGGVLYSAELYDPASNTWSPAGSLSIARWSHTATLLSSGRVLVAAGLNNFPSQTSFAPPAPLASAEIYDPTSDSWSAAGSLSNARAQHSATMLSSGKVLVAGGMNATGLPIASAEQYDPASNAWSGAGGLIDARSGHSATLSPSGQVLVAGGSNGGFLTSSELYDPSSNSWSATASLVTARAYHSATLLLSGQVLAAGGDSQTTQINGDTTTYNYAVTAAAELYGAVNDNVFAIATIASPAAGGSVVCTPNPVTASSTASCTVVPAEGYSLVSISGCDGAVSSISPYTTGAVTAACTVTATFSGGSVGNSFPITTVANPSSGGSITCAPNPVSNGRAANCSANAASGYSLTSISGCGGTAGVANPYVTGAIVAPCTVTALFSVSPVATIRLTSSPNPSIANQPVTLTATITETAPASIGKPAQFLRTPTTSATPTGIVAFTDNGTPLASIALNGNGIASYTVTSLSVGRHTISATYNGVAASEVSVTQLVNAQTTTPGVTAPAPVLSRQMLALLGLTFLALASMALHSRASTRRGPQAEVGRD
jgi:N-acetylneuraminic acid mutarotase